MEVTPLGKRNIEQEIKLILQKKKKIIRLTWYVSIL
jgi:hypothetical protein